MGNTQTKLNLSLKNHLGLPNCRLSTWYVPGFKPAQTTIYKKKKSPVECSLWHVGSVMWACLKFKNLKKIYQDSPCNCDLNPFFIVSKDFCSLSCFPPSPPLISCVKSVGCFNCPITLRVCVCICQTCQSVH